MKVVIFILFARSTFSTFSRLCIRTISKEGVDGVEARDDQSAAGRQHLANEAGLGWKECGELVGAITMNDDDHQTERNDEQKQGC